MALRVSRSRDRVVSADAGRRRIADSQAMTEHPHRARDQELVDRLEDLGFLVTLFSGAAIVAAILILFLVL
jgi:hypothetical protein